MKREHVKLELMKHEVGFDIVMERLRRALKVETERELASELGMSTSNFSNRKSAGSIPFETVVSLCISRSISLDWLFSGTGSPYLNKESEGVDPITVVDSLLMGEVFQALEAAFASVSKKDKGGMDAARFGVLAAMIYNRASLIRNDRQRVDFIRKESAGLANVVEYIGEMPNL